MSRFDIDLAREPLVLPADKAVAPTDEEQQVLSDAAKRLFHDAAHSVVQIRSSKGSGSGFFADDEGRIVTNLHVVADSKYLTVMTPDAMVHPARIEKVDDINDLAVIRIDDARKGKYKPIALGENLPTGATAFVVGHPNGEPRVHIAPGSVERVTTQMEAICNDRSSKFLEDMRQQIERQRRMIEELSGRKSSEPPLEDCQHRYETMMGKLTADQKGDGRAWLERPSVPALIPTYPGNSGGPLIGADGRVAGIARLGDLFDPASSSYVPVEQVKQLLRGDSKFQFKYDYVNESSLAMKLTNSWDKSPVTTGASGLGAATASGLAFRYLPRLTGAAAAAGGMKLAYDDLDTLSYSDGGPRHNQALLALGADASMIAGGIMTFIPRAKTVGMVLASAGALSRLGTEFINTFPVLTSMTRSDGSTKAPFDSKVFGIK